MSRKNDKQKAHSCRLRVKAGTELPPDTAEWYAQYLEQRVRNGRELQAADAAWLERHRKPSRAPGAATRPTAAASEPSRAGAADIPVHTTSADDTPVATAAAVPLLPAAAPEPPPGEPYDPEAAPPPNAGPTPIVDEPPPPPPDPEMQARLFEKGAQRFAKGVALLNSFGTAAALAILGREGIALGPLLEQLGLDPDKTTDGAIVAAVAEFTATAAYAVAQKHPVLAAALPYEDEFITFGSCAASIALIVVNRRLEKAAEDRGIVVTRREPPPAMPAPTPRTPPPRPSSPTFTPAPPVAPPNGANGHAPPEPAPPPVRSFKDLGLKVGNPAGES